MNLPQILFLIVLAAALVGIVVFSFHVVAESLHAKGMSSVFREFKQRIAQTGSGVEKGRWVYCIHRITGVALFVFLCIHIMDVSLYSISHQLYDQVHTLYGTAAMRVFECFLLFSILFHTFNGLRLIAMDLIVMTPATVSRLLLMAVVLTMILGLLGSAIILAPILL